MLGFRFCLVHFCRGTVSENVLRRILPESKLIDKVRKFVSPVACDDYLLCYLYSNPKIRNQPKRPV